MKEAQLEQMLAELPPEVHVAMDALKEAGAALMTWSPVSFRLRVPLPYTGPRVRLLHVGWWCVLFDGAGWCEWDWSAERAADRLAPTRVMYGTMFAQEIFRSDDWLRRTEEWVLWA